MHPEPIMIGRYTLAAKRPRSGTCACAPAGGKPRDSPWRNLGECIHNPYQTSTRTASNCPRSARMNREKNMCRPFESSPPKAADVNLRILEGPAGGYSQGFVGAMYRNPGEKGIPMAAPRLFSKDHSRTAPFGDGTRPCSTNGRLLRHLDEWRRPSPGLHQSTESCEKPPALSA